jgi:hypothetical protein
MKSQEQLEKQLVRILREQADRLEKGEIEGIITYKAIRQQVAVLEDVLELNSYK